MDIGTIIGFVGATALVLVSMVLAGTLGMFWDFLSVIIVFGGAAFATLIAFPIDVFIGAIKAALKTLSQPTTKPTELIDVAVECADTARKGSILALEKVSIEHEFFAKTVRLLVDGYEPDIINAMIDLEINNLKARHKSFRDVVEQMGSATPAWGMIGTVIGLIVIMANLSDPNAIGPGLAVALITTLYGAIVANMIFIPLAGKLKYRTNEEITHMRIIREGVNSISKGENPRAIRQKLESFIAPSQRSAGEE
ncbi:motility protein A [Pseudobacteriovorax antillogorgiicola]|uniref:Chemotaxis protein MotA n=1 Tax=Pseudobacteriovorax antillogorgiicola TaxID=1513793 RepID=A0A1Y6BF03_9BACT|nr:MotA/TolQ/ExbB proton channel family protein [Pseudobacteriovorax antillogorgiicola]TCS56348.1 chemotaxis protein MotA [Pseudobacteriovorax antillogorgiicola]SMF06781.1 chemotaxis protein MotA [Pseudobacteriovorax antillogorgiicola]